MMERFTIRRVKLEVLLAAFLVILLFGQVIAQLYADTTPASVIMQKEFHDQLVLKEATVERNITAERIDTCCFGIIYTEIKMNGTLIANGEVRRFSFNTTAYPLDAVIQSKKASSIRNNGLKTSGTGYDLPHYDWDGVNFLREPGNPNWHVEYDHPNNFDDSGTSGVYYNVPPNEGVPTTLRGSSDYHVHFPKWQLKDVKENFNIWKLIAAGGSLASGIGALLAALSIISLSAITLGAAAVILAILAFYGVMIETFVDNVLTTELDDGWAWLWGFTQYWILGWCIGLSWWMSFGRWRDWGWFLFFPNLIGSCGGSSNRNAR